jgi:hypothetical protein
MVVVVGVARTKFPHEMHTLGTLMKVCVANLQATYLYLYYLYDGFFRLDNQSGTLLKREIMTPNPRINHTYFTVGVDICFRVFYLVLCTPRCTMLFIPSLIEHENPCAP